MTDLVKQSILIEVAVSKAPSPKLNLQSVMTEVAVSKSPSPNLVLQSILTEVVILNINGVIFAPASLLLTTNTFVVPEKVIFNLGTLTLSTFTFVSNGLIFKTSGSLFFTENKFSINEQFGKGSLVLSGNTFVVSEPSRFFPTKALNFNTFKFIIGDNTAVSRTRFFLHF